MTPLWPQANGEVERQNRSLLKWIKIAQIEKRNWKEELGSFLIMYRTTPHFTTGVGPAELLFHIKLRTGIPGIEEVPVDDQEVRDRDNEAKEKGKLYADAKRCARESEVKEGDTVFLRQDRENKLTPTFRPEPYCVLDKSGSSVVVESPDGVPYKRNSTHVKNSLDRSNAPECDISLSPPISNSSTEHQAQPSVNECDEHREKLMHRQWSGVWQNPTLSRTLRPDLSGLGHYQHGLRTLLCLSNRTFHQTSMIEDFVMLCLKDKPSEDYEHFALLLLFQLL